MAVSGIDSLLYRDQFSTPAMREVLDGLGPSMTVVDVYEPPPVPGRSLLLALIAYVPACNTFFGTAPLEAWHLSLSVPFALLILLGDEFRRVLVRRNNRFVRRWLTW